MNATVGAPDFSALADEADYTDREMEIQDVEAADRFDGWTVSVSKCRRQFIDAIEQREGLRVGTMYPDGNSIKIHVRLES